MNVNEPTTSCCVCYKEIPLDAAFTPEGAEYELIRKSVSPAPHAARITSLPKHAPDRALSRSF